MFGREEKVPLIRLAIVQYVILGIFLLLVWGLWRLQVLHSDYYTNMAEQNRVKEVPILAPRGRLMDREGRPIVENYPSFSALLLRSQGKISDATLDGIASGLDLDAADLKARVRRQAAMPGYQPIFLKYDITPNELAFIESHRNEYPELDTITVHRRLYPKNGFMAHVIGYVGEVSEGMLNSPRYELYNAGDIVGQSGIEAEYNDLLMGKNGSRRVMVNSRGKEVGELSDTPAIPGTPLRLTIDLDLQIAAEEVLGDRTGAIVAMDPHTGEVLAMVSRPTFDPNAFAVRISSKEWSSLINDPGKPLLNKAIQAQLAPGSVFKIIMSVAGWQEGIAQTLRVFCHGGADFYGRYFKCWLKGGHGEVSLTKGIYQSCDVYFYTLAEKLGIDRIAKYAEEFGLGQKTGIDLPQEASGLIPSEEWKVRNYRQKWFAGETISVGIGQGAVTVTPVQLMRAIGAIATGGHMVRPHLVFPDEVPERYRTALHYSETKDIPIDPQGWKAITDAMSEVVQPEGTAPSAHIVGLDIAGKTGSAQMVSNEMKAKMSGASKEEYKDNGWFVGFTPRRDPDVVVCVLFQGGEHGALAARLATKVIEAYEDKKNHRPMPDLRTPMEEAERPATGNPNVMRHPNTKSAPNANNGPDGKPVELGDGRRPGLSHGVGSEPLEITGVWSEGGAQVGKLHAASFRLQGPEGEFHRAIAAPGLEAYARQQAQRHRVSQGDGRTAGKWLPASLHAFSEGVRPVVATLQPSPWRVVSRTVPTSEAISGGQP